MNQPEHGQIVPEPILWAHLHLLLRVILFVRNRSSGEHRIRGQQLFDLDAIHNIPVMLFSYGEGGLSPEWIRDELARYDSRWGVQSGPSLQAILNDAFAAASAEP